MSKYTTENAMRELDHAESIILQKAEEYLEKSNASRFHGMRTIGRNGKGMRMFANIMTAMMTWKQRGMNPLEEVRKYL